MKDLILSNWSKATRLPSGLNCCMWLGYVSGGVEYNIGTWWLLLRVFRKKMCYE